ncbi:TPA: hypothetical protein ACH3X3_001385 [Trebouxia sp. C0006]
MRLAMLVLSVLLVSVTSRQLQDVDADSALEHQRILGELEEVHQLRERMLQQAATYITSSGAPAPAPEPSGGTQSSPSSPASVSAVNGGTSSGVNEGSTASGAKG